MYLINGLGALGAAPEPSAANIYRLAQGASEAAYVGGASPTFVTELRPYNLSSGVAPDAPAAIVAALDYWFRPEEGGWGIGFTPHAAGWGNSGRIWVRFSDPSDQTGVRRDGALRSAVRRAEAALGSGVRLLLPGEAVPSAARPTPAPDSPTMARSQGDAGPPPPDASPTTTAPKAGFFDTTTVLVLLAAAGGLGYLYYTRRKAPSASASV